MIKSSAKLIYFSPTGTTRKVVEAIAQGLQFVSVDHVDLTLPEAGSLKLPAMRDEVAIIGAPVYSGRLPAEAVSRMQGLRGNSTPAVVVVVYGNRAYDDALLELRDLVLMAGFKPIGAAAFVGEHSYSTEDTPIAVGRPDEGDLRKAYDFGGLIDRKLRAMGTLEEIGTLFVPGNSPYRERRTLSNISPVTRETACTRCETCALVCPTGAVSVRETVVTDTGLCIRCCACVKTCPSGARVMEDSRIREVAEQLSVNCRERKEPEMYL
jgi:ferredoxin